MPDRPESVRTKSAGKPRFFVGSARDSGTVAGMILMVPLLMVFGVAATVWAGGQSMEHGAVEKPVRVAMAEPVRPIETGTVEGQAEGFGAYLKGAISDLNGDPQAAYKDYLAALADDPDNLALRQRVLELSLMGGDVATALRIAKTLPEIDRDIMSRLLLAVDMAHSGKIKEARNQIHAAAKTAPSLLHFELFRAYLDFANGTKAAKVVHRLEVLPLAPALEGRRQYHIARLWLKAGEPVKALVALEKSHEVEPTAIMPVILLGETYVRQGEPDRAAALYTDFSAKNPSVALLLPRAEQLTRVSDPVPFASTLDEDMAASLFDFALLVWGEGALGPARQLMNVALWVDPNQPYYVYYAGVLMEVGNDLDAAEKDYATLVDNPTLGVGAKLRLAEVHFKQGKQKKGWNEATDLLKDYPDVAVIRRSVAQMAFERENYSRAVEEYSYLLEHLPEGAPAGAKEELLFARGVIYERDKQYGKAALDLQAALEISPANAQIMNYLGYMWLENDKNVDDALNLLKKAHLLAPHDSAITDSLGWGYYKIGDYDAAVQYLEVAAEEDPDSPEIVDHLGDAYAKLGYAEEALKQWRRALDLVEKGAEEPRERFMYELEKKIKKAE